MGYRFATVEDREAVVGLVVDAAEAASLRLTPPELASSPVVFQRQDRTSVFRPKHSTVFSSEVLLAAEDRLLERARATTGPTVPLTTVERMAGRPDREGRMLGDDQATALAKIAVSGRQVDVLVGPAGAGKTTAMNALRRAWEREHGTGSVVGLAPSAVAAQVLADDLGIGTENTAKWWQNHLMTGETFHAGQLVIVDEASLAGTLSLDRITALAVEAGAKVLLVGDYAQRAEDAWRQLGEVVAKLEDAKLDEAAQLLADAAPDVLAYTAFPKDVWRKIWSNNPQERLNRELRRRTDVVGNFPHRPAIVRLVAAVLAEQHDEWQVARRYISIDARCRTNLTVIQPHEQEQPDQLLPATATA